MRDRPSIYASAVEMALSIVPDRVENECLAQKHLDLVVAPVLRGEGLQEHDDALQMNGSAKKGGRK